MSLPRDAADGWDDALEEVKTLLADAADVGPRLVDLLVDADLAEHAFGQGPANRHHRAVFARRDAAHRSGRADQQLVVAQAQAAMAVGVHQLAARQGTGGHSQLALLFRGCCWHWIGAPQVGLQYNLRAVQLEC